MRLSSEGLLDVGCSNAQSQVRAGQAIDVMNTASHNPGHDNGVKLVGPFWEDVSANYADT